jgi:hypothetical protein
MNSRDPWSVIVTDPAGDVIFPRAVYRDPFTRLLPSWIHAGSSADSTRQVFENALVSGDFAPRTGDTMKKRIGAELTALSAPGGFFGYGGSPFNQFYGNGLGYGSPYGALYGSAFRPYSGPPPGYGVQVGPYILGADVSPTPSIQRTGLVADLAPVLAPATGGISAKQFLDDQRVLHVEICVDGKCHQTSMDLGPAIDMVMQKLAAWHQAQHASMPDSGSVTRAVDNAVNEAGKMVVGALVSRHIRTIAGSWIDDLGSAISAAVSSVGGGIKHTFQKYKKPIGVAAGIAASAAASEIPGAGPAAAPLAGKLANDLVNSTGGNTPAQQSVAQAQQQAKTDPTVAVALNAAQNAVVNTAAAYHVQETAKAAAQGNTQAQKQIVQVATDAQNGDPAAKAVADIVANAMQSEWGADLWTSLTGRGPDTVSGQWYDVVGCVPRTYAGQWVDIVGQSLQALDTVREQARAHAVTKPGPAAGVVITADGRAQGRGFRTLDDAIDWLDHVTRNRGSFTYAAAYEKDANGAAYIQAEEVGGSSQTGPQQASAPIRRDVATIY